jgi:purine-nucleoside phosphorylase
VTEFLSREHYQAAADWVRRRISQQPQIGLVLGSGLGGLVESIEDGERIATQEIPHWPRSTVAGHSGELIAGRLRGHRVLVQRGRVHYYEGYSMSHVTLPIRVMQLLGVRTLILTNAAGGLRRDMAAGDLMVIADHINMVGMGGANPLRGPNDETLGPRFPDMTQPYDVELRAIAKEVALEAGIPLREGVYVAVAGPSFETPADLRFLQQVGAHAVGMSTVPEVIVARHGGTRVLAISGISNLARTEPGSHVETTHEEVLETGKTIVPRLTALLEGILERLPPAN